ncbi:MAG: hypothetical protein Q7T26_11230 [Dehalococcoidia bacterium]|nr:hypothetical protein [Dehalococcoidia bacterium]
MATSRKNSVFLKKLDENLDDVLGRPESPALVTDLQKRLPKVNEQTLKLIIAASFAILDTIDTD